MDCGVFVTRRYLELVNNLDKSELVLKDKCGLSIDEICNTLNYFGNNVNAYHSKKKVYKGIYIIYFKRKKHFMLVEHLEKEIYVSDQNINHLKINYLLYWLIFPRIILIDLERYKV